jgi:hypothetical protein
MRSLVEIEEISRGVISGSAEEKKRRASPGVKNAKLNLKKFAKP